MNPEILLSIIQLTVGGIVTFLAILLMSKTRDAAWICLVCGFLFSYAATIFGIMVKLGILTETTLCIAGIHLSTLLCVALPNLFFIAAFILMMIKNK